MTPFVRRDERPIEGMGGAAVRAALEDADLGPGSIGEAFCGSGYGGPLIGQRILRSAGISGLPITNVENACSSGSTAFREAVAAVASGRVDTAIAVGADKLSQFGGGTLPLNETDPEVSEGMVMPALYAMRAQSYLNDTGGTPETLAKVSVKARAHGALNPNAQFTKRVTVDEVLGARMVADPLTLYMCCPTGDGAAAAIVASTPRDGQRAIKVAASVLQSGHYEPAGFSLARSELTERTSRLAYEMAALEPSDVDVAEVHDAFAIAELMYYEGLQFCERGGGAEFLDRGESSLGGRTPVNTGGGLLARGHPIGATGVAQLCEMVWQLRGTAGARQVDGARTALTHCTGGGISGMDHGACSIHILAA